MPRVARVTVADVPHHISQRGNRQQTVFFDDADRHRYLALLGEHADLYGLGVQAYCLMDNHVHLVIVPSTPDGLGQAMRRMNMLYTRHVNRRQGWTGHLWEGRFYSCPLDERHFWAAVRYVERNPVQAGLVPKAWEYRWSSAAAHCGLRDDRLLTDRLEVEDQVEDWKAFLLDEDDEAVNDLRRTTKTGRPCGTADFIGRLEVVLGRRLSPKKRGPRVKRGRSTN